MTEQDALLIEIGRGAMVLLMDLRNRAGDESTSTCIQSIIDSISREIRNVKAASFITEPSGGGQA